MKVTAKIDVTPEQYFRHLCDGVIEDIKKNTNREIAMEDLMDGYSYERKVTYKNRQIIIRFAVGPLIENKYFQVSYETEETKCLYSYDFSVQEGEAYVTYTEDNGYKRETVGNFMGNLKKKLTQRTLENKIFQNIELTTTYIKNHET